MARIKYSALVQSINGSIAGTTFQNNRYGFTAKRKSAIKKPNTLYQQQRKNLLMSNAQQWRVLSEANRTQWFNWAEANPTPTRLNPDAYLNGYNLFMAYHNYRRLVVPSFLNSPSNTLQNAGTYAKEVFLDGGVLTLEYVAIGITGTWYILVFMTPPIPMGQEFVKFTPRLVGSSTMSSSGSVNVTSQYQTVIGVLPALGQWIGVRTVRICNTTAQILVDPVIQIEVIE